MIRSKISSERKLSVLRLAVRLRGRSFDLDEDVARPLGLAHDVASETFGRLKRGGHLSYSCWRGLSGKVLYRIDAVAYTPVSDSPQPSLF